MLRRPILAKRTDRRILAQTNDYCGDPEKWFDSEYFQHYGLFSASFDFFVNWEEYRICDEVWIKRISDSEISQNQTVAQLIQQIRDCDGKDYSNRLYSFLSFHQLVEKYMIFRDVPEAEWENGTERVAELDMSKYIRNEQAISFYTANEIQEKIARLRVTPTPIGRKGLIYSTSSLEGYLSVQPFFWPGDADTVLYDQNNNVKAVIEFKKCTANSHIPFEEQRIDNYLSADILKYQSLALLRDRLNTKLFVLYYPTPDDINYIIIETIDGDIDNLHAIERYELPLPNQRSAEIMTSFAAEFNTRILRR